MFHQKYLQNCLLSLLGVYLIKAAVDQLCIFSTNYYNKYPELSKMVQNVIIQTVAYSVGGVEDSHTPFLRN